MTTRSVCLALSLVAAHLALLPGRGAAADFQAHWIWSPAHEKGEAPEGTCYFRKTFELGSVAEGVVQIAADNQFQLYVNGQPAGQGNDWRKMQSFDVSKMLVRGTNVVAVAAQNAEIGSAGLVARVLVKSQNGPFESHSTDGTWKTSVRRFQSWTLPNFPDRDWLPAADYGALHATLPWGDEVVIAGQGARFALEEGFVIERLMRDEEVGSLIAMVFDSRGNIYASQEGGHLLLLTDSDRNGIHDRVTTYCDQIKNVQGILALGRRVFAVGNGPEGPALYRLYDADRNGEADEIVKLVGFKGSRGEHGAHAVRLGPDGLLYVVIGDHARVDAEPVGRSPYARWYEGDLVRPRYEDPQGHAVGIPAPGGTVFRTDANGSFVSLVAGGLRNAYDFAFDSHGELFTYDADMEWDRGAPWYRPTRINHVTAGAELGWRSGWAKWPKYWLDSLPPAVELGAGSPTGIEFYDHDAFPEKYRGTLFGCDWATGRIHAIRLERQGASYVGHSEVFLEGRPLNATDIAVGPDGALYFCTGGRGTDGGVYRVRWTGEQDNPRPAATAGVERALHLGQIDSDWARAQAAREKRTAGEAWGPGLRAAALDQDRPLRERLRAVDLLVYFGPRPDDALLVELADDDRPEVRAKAARLMFASSDSGVREHLEMLLGDGDPLVRRVACESLLRSGPLPEADLVLPLLSDDDRFTAFAARRLLEQLPVESWARQVLTTDDVDLFLRGTTALVNLERREPTTLVVLQRVQELLAANRFAGLTETQQLDLLRVTQLALVHSDLPPGSLLELGDTLLALYPTDNSLENRELVRLLVHLQVMGAAEKFAAELEKDLPLIERLQIGAYAARLQTGWSKASKLALAKLYQEARDVEGGYSVGAYIEQFARDFFKQLTRPEQIHLLSQGEHWPATALSVLASLPPELDDRTVETIIALDRRIEPLCLEDDAQRRLRVGVVAVLGRADQAEAAVHLQEAYRRDPEYREPIAMSLTQRPGGDNWAYLVDALRTIEGPAATEVVQSLLTVGQRPKGADPYRHLILLALRSNDPTPAVELLEHWTRQQPTTSSDSAEQVAAWQSWYAETFPEAAPAELPTDEGRDKWSYEELLTFLESPAGKQGDAAQGERIFVKAQCAACHRMGKRGESVGPDLTAIGLRFQRKEILESIVYPSHVISDQYASHAIVAGGRTYTGLIAGQNERRVTMLLPTGKKIDLARRNIDQIAPSDISSMPTGLLNPLSLEQVADLFAYLSQHQPAAVAGRQTTGR